MSYEKKNILILGGLGFLGSNLAHRLVSDGAHVTLLDNLNPLYGGNKFNIDGIEKHIQVIVGDIQNEERYEKLGLIIARRILHAPEGSFNYKKDPTVPEIGICLDFLNHMAINKDGDVSVCVRFDPKRVGVIGNAKQQILLEIWNSPKRVEWLGLHKKGRRDMIPLCSYCHFWGVPTGKNSTKIRHKKVSF